MSRIRLLSLVLEELAISLLGKIFMSTEFLYYKNKINRLPLAAYLFLSINEYDTQLDYVHTSGFAYVDSHDDPIRRVLDANYAEGTNVVDDAFVAEGSTVDDVAKADKGSIDSHNDGQETVHTDIEGIPSLHLLFL
ncbi:hypothetical protein ACIQD3_23835 [Peribacillus loiseleuriae]|uniref:hypothetical protein n=1 Tax=Peribacillus loiseleuriae TaxID=1679170 RepID=UPI0038004F31